MKTAFITGATAGFGEECARLFAAQGWRLIICGRRQERLDALTAELAPTPVHAVQLDVRDNGAVCKTVEELPADFAAIDVLVNNAGLALGLEPCHNCSLDDWETMVDTNIKGLMYVTRAVLPCMMERNAGHVINLGSIAGSYPYKGANVYGSTKAFVKQFSMNLKTDLLGTNIRVTNIEPGMAETEFSLVRFHGDADKSCKVYENVQPLTARDVAEAIYWAVDRPAHVTISSIEMWPTAQAWGGIAVHRGE